jgi:hypothetical protein
MALGGFWYFYSIIRNIVIDDRLIHLQYSTISAGSKRDVDRPGKKMLSNFLPCQSRNMGFELLAEYQRVEFCRNYRLDNSAILPSA